MPLIGEPRTCATCKRQFFALVTSGDVTCWDCQEAANPVALSRRQEFRRVLQRLREFAMEAHNEGDRRSSDVLERAVARLQEEAR